MSQMTTGTPDSSARDKTDTQDALSVGEMTMASTCLVMASWALDIWVLASSLES